MGWNSFPFMASIGSPAVVVVIHGSFSGHGLFGLGLSTPLSVTRVPVHSALPSTHQGGMEAGFDHSSTGDHTASGGARESFARRGPRRAGPDRDQAAHSSA